MPKCDRCGQPAEGYATASGPGFDLRLCHPDDPSKPDCYKEWQAEEVRRSCVCQEPSCVRCMWQDIVTTVK